MTGMPPARVRALRCVDLAVVDLETAERFYTDVWHLEKIAADDGMVHLRATGRHHHVLTLRRAGRTGIVRIVLDAQDRSAVDRLYEQVQQSGQPTAAPPHPLGWPGGGYGFGFKDPEGRNFAVVCDVADHAEGADRPDRPRKLSHVNLNCHDNEATFRFMRDVLGFRLSDQTKVFRFIRCNADHHCLVLGFNDDATLNHIAFEMPDLDSVMRGCGRMRDHGYPIEWGPGRHGPGNNVFAYFVGPEEVPLEYTGEMTKVDDTHRVRGPEEWGWPPGRLDHWGIMPGPTVRVVRTQRLFRFTDDGHQLER